MGNTKASDKATLPQLAYELDANQAAGWRKDAALLAGHTASTEQITQLAAVLAESPHLQRLAGLFADDVPALMAGNWEQVLNESKETDFYPKEGQLFVFNSSLLHVVNPTPVAGRTVIAGDIAYLSRFGN